MEIRKNFGKYWVGGIILAFIAGAIQWVTSYLSVAVKLTVQPAWLWYLLIGVVGILIFIFVPWIYGRIIEWLYLNFISKK
ncbi:MAG: hypothetical protein ACXVZU_03465 [Methanobacteriaceae archaeon]